jgi:hypothetical protein
MEFGGRLRKSGERGRDNVGLGEVGTSKRGGMWSERNMD